MNKDQNKSNGGPKKGGGLVLQYLNKNRDQIALALPRHMNADRMARIVLTECRKTPKLFECSPQSLMGAVIQVSQLGLEPGSGLGHAYLVPFWNGRLKVLEVQAIIGYRGMLDLCYRSGRVLHVEAVPVFAGDHFAYEKGLNQILEHRRQQPECWDAEKLTHVYVIARLRDSNMPAWEVYSREFLDQRRDRSEAFQKGYGPWHDKNDQIDMYRKTAVRAMFKYLPVSIELQRAVGLDEQGDLGIQDNSLILEGEFTELGDGAADPDNKPQQTKTEQVRDKIAGTGKPEPTAEPDQPPASGPPPEAELFADLEKIINNPANHTRDDINDLAALSDAISPARSDEFRAKLKQADDAIKAASAPPKEAEESAQGAFFGG